MKKVTGLIVILLLSANSFAQGHFVVAFSGNGQDHMNIYIISATINGVDLVANDEIAAFDGSVCCGKTILTQSIDFYDSDTYAALAPSRKDDGELNGYTIGNAISFKIWDASTNKELSDITAEFIDPNDGQTISPPTYTPGEAAFVKLSVSVRVNKKPISNAGNDQSINEGENVILDGTASSDPDGDPLTYQWTAPAGIMLSSTTVAQPTFIAPEVTADTDYIFSLVVNDGTESSIADDVVINVKQVNKVPVSNAGPDQEVDEDVKVTLDGSASSDSDNAPNTSLTYTWTSVEGLTINNSTTESPNFTAPFYLKDSTLRFVLVVNDGAIDSNPDTVLIKVKHTNLAPVANAGPDQTINETSICTLYGLDSFDPDGNTLTYLWSTPAGIKLSSNTTVNPTFTVPEVQHDTILNFSLVVSDGIAYSDTSVIKVFVVNVIKTRADILSFAGIKVYPNPSNGIFIIDGLIANRKNKIEIYTLSGKLINQMNSNSIIEKIDISNQIPETYLLFINKKSFKIIKQNIQ